MAGLLGDIAIKMCISVVLAGILCFAFPGLLLFGSQPGQAFGVFSTLTYCAVALFGKSGNRPFHILSIPVIAQFLHLFQKYDFTPGANSIWRLLPFLLLDCYLILFVLRQSPEISPDNKLLLISWIVIHAFFIAISPNAPGILAGATVLYLLTLPLVYIYLTSLQAAADFRLHLERGLSVLYIVLGLGTFGLVIVGAGYKGSDNLLVTRNISDTNVTIAYFILLWPFALLYARRFRFRLIASLLPAAMLLAIVILSFSRGAAMIVIPYLICSMLWIFSLRQICIVAATVFILYLNSTPILTELENRGLTYSWQLRVQDFDQGAAGYKQLQVSSGRAAIHETAMQLFLENPAWGHGIGSFEKLGPGYREAHSLFFTLLAEEGIVGALYQYGLLFLLFGTLLTHSIREPDLALLLLALIFYLLFNHTVGSVFVIIPAKSLTINCFAPVLLICLYCYATVFAQESV